MVGLGERLASLDVREFTSLSSLRSRLIQMVEDFIAQNPNARDHTAETPFYFCSSNIVILPVDLRANNLGEFIDILKQVSVHSIHYHFIEARLRRKLETNDFSLWLERDLGLSRTAARLNHIDIYTSTLDGVKRKIIQVLQTPTD